MRRTEEQISISVSKIFELILSLCRNLIVLNFCDIFPTRKCLVQTSYTYTQSARFDGICQIYSLPYDFEYFVDVDNFFQGGMFKKVRLLKMVDGIPFEQQFFKLI